MLEAPEPMIAQRKIRQVADPQVTRRKFAAEVSQYRHLKSEWREKGFLLLGQHELGLSFALVASQLSPRSLLFGVRFDFTDFDLRPPSVQFIDPLTGEELVTDSQALVGIRTQTGGANNLVQQHPGGPLFLCIRGVREYHEHPFHSGDPWFRYRTGGPEGSLYHLLDVLHRHAILPASHKVEFQAKVTHAVDTGKLPVPEPRT